HELATRMITTLLEHIPVRKDILVFVNGLGGIPTLEINVFFRDVIKALKNVGVQPTRSLVGTYVSSLDMNGVSITITAMDTDLIEFWDAPVNTPALRWGVNWK